MANPSKDDWIQLFKDNIVKLRYEDKDGNTTDRRVTLHESLITYLPSANPNKSRVVPETAIVVWDLDKNMWRRLRLDNIMFVRGIEPVEQPNEPSE